MLIWILALTIAYLLGSIPFGYVLVRTFKDEDIRATGSGNIGATNVARTGSKGLAAATFFLDALKGFLAVVIAQHLVMSHSFPDGYRVAAAAGLFVMLGHIFPVWLAFRGGKGAATALGVFMALSPGVALISLLLFIVVAVATRYVSLASIVAAITMVVLAIAYDNKRSLFVDLCYFVMGIFVVAKHHSNIRRLLAGTESRIGAKKV